METSNACASAQKPDAEEKRGEEREETGRLRDVRKARDPLL